MKVLLLVTNLGVFSTYLDDFEKGEEYLNEAKLQFEEIYGDEFHEYSSILYSNLGDLYQRKSEYKKSIDMYQKSLSGTELNNIKEINSLGNAYYRQGEYEKAIEMHKKSIDLHNKYYKSVPHLTLAVNYSNLAQNYIEIGEFDLAAETIQNSITMKMEIFGDEPNQSIAYSYEKLGGQYANQYNIPMQRKCLIEH